MGGGVWIIICHNLFHSSSLSWLLAVLKTNTNFWSIFLREKLRRCTLFPSFRSLGLVSHFLGHFSTPPCFKVITDSFKVTFEHYLWLVVKSATADQAFMGLNVSCGHFGNQTAVAEDVRMEKGGGGEGVWGRWQRDMWGQQPWRLNQAEKRGEPNRMKEEGGRGDCTTKWTEHGSVKRKGREGSLSHSFGTPCSAPPPLSPLEADKETEGGAARAQKREECVPVTVISLLFLLHNN